MICVGLLSPHKNCISGGPYIARTEKLAAWLQNYIDLVFYNYILKCFVLIDLKIEKITHQDVGQMDMYIRMYDELKRSEGDNPTIGFVFELLRYILCVNAIIAGSDIINSILIAVKPSNAKFCGGYYIDSRNT